MTKQEVYPKGYTVPEGYIEIDFRVPTSGEFWIGGGHYRPTSLSQHLPKDPRVIIKKLADFKYQPPVKDALFYYRDSLKDSPLLKEWRVIDFRIPLTDDCYIDLNFSSLPFVATGFLHTAPRLIVEKIHTIPGASFTKTWTTKETYPNGIKIPKGYVWTGEFRSPVRGELALSVDGKAFEVSWIGGHYPFIILKKLDSLPR